MPMRAFPIHPPHSGNAYNHCPCHLRTCGREISYGMTSERALEAATPETKIKGRVDSGQELPRVSAASATGEMEVALLTGGSDRPYAYGLSTQLLSKGIRLDIIGSDDLEFPELRDNPQANFL